MQSTDTNIAAHGGERQLRNQANADAGRDQALHRLVVVALEGDPRLESGGVAGADHVAGTGAGARGLHPRLLMQVPEPDLTTTGQRVGARQREVKWVFE